MSNTFEDFVNKQNSNLKKEEAVDWNKNREDWILFVHSLYKDIRSYLKNYIDKGLVNIIEDNIMITEEYIGSYDISRLIITVGKAEVTLTPIGTLIVGSKGRLDMSGARGSVSFLLVDRKVSTFGFTFKHVKLGSSPIVEPPPAPKDWTWKILNRVTANNNTKINFLDLNEQSFQDAFLSVANG